MTPFHSLLIGGLLVILLAMRWKAPRAAARTATNAAAPNAPRKPAIMGPEAPVCISCECYPAQEPVPHMVEVRAAIDADWLDELCMRLGFRRDVRYAVSIPRGVADRHLCGPCHRVARAICEEEIARRDAARAATATLEAESMSNFGAFGMRDVLRARTAELRARLQAETTVDEVSEVQKSIPVSGAQDANSPAASSAS